MAVVFAALGLLRAWPEAPAPGGASGDWEHLLDPVHVGRPMARGFVAQRMSPGRERDVVLLARRPSDGATVEIHVLDRGRWEGALETPSFGVGYETPRSSASPAESLFLTRLVRDALARHDQGGLGPVDEIPLTAKAPAPEGDVLRLRGQRGWFVGACVVLATLLFTTLPGGPALNAVWLFLVGALLRFPRLDLPFAIDQDVQRMFTGHLPLGQILTGTGLDDRHPPLYFLVLHVAQWFGQSEAVGRAPAVLFGALLGPAIVLGARAATGTRGPQAAMAGLLAATSPELVLRSREVSDIPLFALLVVTLAAWAGAQRVRRQTTVVAATSAAALYTYYLAPLVLVATAVAVRVGRGARRRALQAIGVGVLLGVPALVLELRIFRLDEPARKAARDFPAFAWGEHGALEMARLLSVQALAALGPAVLGLLVAVALVRGARRHRPSLTALAGLVVTFGGIVAIAPFARVQPYYLVAVLPLAWLALAVGLPNRGAGAWGAALALGAAGVVWGVPALERSELMYHRGPDVFMTSLAEVADAQPERRILLSVDFDATLLAYELARRHDVPMDWSHIHGADGVLTLDGLPQTLVPLVRAHHPGNDPEAQALARFDAAVASGPVLMIARPTMGLPRLAERVARCETLVELESAFLVRCGATGP